VICGIDLAGKESNPTGVCILNGETVFYTVYTDTELLATINTFSPSIVAVDAPLSFHGEPFRECDRALRKHYPVLPLTFKGMQALTQRGIHIKSVLPYPVIEVYPYASKKVLGITCAEDLHAHGIERIPSTIHQVDAAAAALTAQYYLKGHYKAYGKKDTIIVPQ
jgi:predicted nuclease with RNAse H fold